MKVCLSVSTLSYPEGSGHRWVFLNWALGLRGLGCDVIWLDAIDGRMCAQEMEKRVKGLREAIGSYGFAQSLCVASRDQPFLPLAGLSSCLPMEAADGADVLLNFNYALTPEAVRWFKRSALMDLDPGILQINLANGSQRIAPHDCYFSIGETAGTSQARFPDAGLRWQHTKPCVAVDCWPMMQAASDSPFTTISHWWMDEWIVTKSGSGRTFCYKNDKRTGFKPFVNLPKLVPARLELALALDGDSAEQIRLERKGWQVREAHDVTSTIATYQSYIQQSKGEFSCCKPAYSKLRTGWLSDRTACYLASGKPAIVQDTGSKYLPDEAGLFRFRTLEQARHHVEAVCSDYEHQCRLARSLAVEHFDAKAVVCKLLTSVVC